MQAGLLRLGRRRHGHGSGRLQQNLPEDAPNRQDREVPVQDHAREDKKERILQRVLEEKEQRVGQLRLDTCHHLRTG